MKKLSVEEKNYHHGNLRAALIESGLELIAEQGVRALTLREIGKRLKVSRSAAYRHFASKSELLAALSEAGFALFGDALQAARTRSATGTKGKLEEMAVAYVRFAAENRAYFEVMFGPLSQEEEPKTEAGQRAYRILEDTVREGQAAGKIRGGNLEWLTQLLWSMVHGISLLGLEKDLKTETGRAEFTRFCCEVLWSGLESAYNSST
jgi:AcrR family transcriptional regulator